MTLNLDGINYLAVVVGAVIFMVVGALWYSPLLFASTWLRLIGKRMEDIQGGTSDYVMTFIGALLTSLVLAVIVNVANATTLVDGLIVGAVVWGGFSATSTLTYSTFEGPPYSVWLLFNGYQLVVYLLVGGLLALWV